MCDCGCGEKPTRTRFSPTGDLEVSYDDGVTWQPAPDQDPRITSVEFPPLPGEDGEDKRCNAAASVAKVIEDDIIQKLKEVQFGITLVAVIAAVLAIYLSGGALAPLVTALVGAAMQAGKDAIEAAFTTEVWNDLICIVYCNLSDDASMDQFQWQAAKSEINEQFEGVVQTLLYGTFDAFGAVGITNAARSNRATSSDCGECGCNECPSWSVPSNGSTVNSSVTSIERRYQITISGTFIYDTGTTPPYQGDGVYVSLDSWATHEAYDSDYVIEINGVAWPADTYNPAHTYTQEMNGTGSALAFKIRDTNYPDNSGSLTVEVCDIGEAI